MDDRRVIDALLRRMQLTAPADVTDDTFWEWVEIAAILAAPDALEAVGPLPLRSRSHLSASRNS
jgi:hypothetical protein